MKNLSGVALKVFSFLFVLFVLPRLLTRIFFPTYINGHVWPSISYILVQGLAMTAIATFIVVGIHVLLVRRISKSADTDYGVRQRLETQVPQSASTLFETLKNRLANRQWEVVQQDENSGLLRFEIYNKWRTWNEVVTIQLLSKGSMQTTVFAESKPGGWLALADNGKNLRNIQVLREVLGQQERVS
ncbi:MAG TPA: hypothetical protein PLO67_10230 [Saprospiraceae bacterium]|nr:hypothetical protein [Saprospiraceae bacterium]HPI05263.1 hypothetical protein [Saprospiraceae bacterium]